MFPYLQAAGFAPEVIYQPDRATERPHLDGLDADRIAQQHFRIVCFQKVGGEKVKALARALSARGVKTVFIVCDVVDKTMASATDATVVVTDFLKQLYPEALQPRITTVHDGIERLDLQRPAGHLGRGTRDHPLHAVLVTSSHLDLLPVLHTPPPWLRVTVVGRYPDKPNVQQRLRTLQWHLRQLPTLGQRWQGLRFALHPRIHCVPWHPLGVYQWLQSADIGIIPIETPPGPPGASVPPSWMVKSENRLTLKMAMGLPVVATPIPAYECVIQQGVNGFLAEDRAQWLHSLEKLRDPAYRQQVGATARASVAVRYSMAEQARQLVAVLRGLLGSA
nr:glycosyltransferase [uncultured Albidiferax sp.]